MYLRLMAQSQPAGPSSRRTDAGVNARRDYRGGAAAGRKGGRFAFINAVMAHARDGGDPLDIEEACHSDGFTQDGYAGTPQMTPTQEGMRTADSSPCDAMSSGGSRQSSNGSVENGGRAGEDRISDVQ